MPGVVDRLLLPQPRAPSEHSQEQEQNVPQMAEENGQGFETAYGEATDTHDTHNEEVSHEERRSHWRMHHRRRVIRAL